MTKEEEIREIEERINASKKTDNLRIYLEGLRQRLAEKRKQEEANCGFKDSNCTLPKGW